MTVHAGAHLGANYFGARVTRLEDAGLLRGQGRFVDDISLPGMLHACFVRSPHAHARIRGIDGKAALALPRVHAVLTADDLPQRLATGQIPMLVPSPLIRTPRTQIALAREEVCYVGQTVAVVIAEDRYIAEDAAALVAVDYDILPAVSDARDAAKPDAPRVHCDLADNVAAYVPMAYGDVDAAFASAPHVFEEELFLHRGAAMTLETRAVLASYDAVGDMLTVWSSTQTPHLGRGTLADLLERNLESIRVIAPSVGGGFGTKAPFYPEEAVIPAAAMKLGRPVKWIEDRREHFLSATQERDQYWTVAIAVDDNGKILGLRGQHAARHRRLSAVGHHRALHRGDHVSGTLPRARLQDGNNGSAHQPRPDHGGARRRAAAGGVRDGAADRPRRARIEHRPRRGASPQHDPRRRNALCGGAHFPRRQAARL